MPNNLCCCGCGQQTAGGQFLPGHNVVAQYAGVDKAALFWSRVERRGPDECWPWIAKARTPFGAGVMRWENRAVPAYRIAYLLTHGRIPDNLGVLHSCDNPGCCNPAHLRVGTQVENMRDAAVRNRMPRDLRHHYTTPITWRGMTHSIREWGRILGINEHTVSRRLLLGWTIERTMTTRPRAYRQKP